EQGGEAPLAARLQGKPAVLVLGYLGCKDLCPLTLSGALEALSASGLEPGRDYRAAFVSIDSRDDRGALAREKEARIALAALAAWDPAVSGELLPAASDVAQRIDALFFTLLGVTGTVVAAVTVLIAAFCLRYRRAAHADRSDAPANHRALEIAWTVIPLAAFLVLFAWGAIVYAALYGGGAGAMAVFVVGKQWMWKIQHGNGRREIDE